MIPLGGACSRRTGRIYREDSGEEDENEELNATKCRKHIAYYEIDACTRVGGCVVRHHEDVNGRQE